MQKESEMLLVKMISLLLLVMCTSFVHGIAVSSYKERNQSASDIKIQNSAGDICSMHEDCRDNQKCVEHQDGWKTCQCADGLSGDNCETMDWCEGNGKFKYCKGDDGTCEYSTEKRSIVCTCGPGKELHPEENRCRETCESHEECYNGGECRGPEEKKFCHCKSGLEGNRCEIITDCIRGKYSKCGESGGICMFHGTKAMCLCHGHQKFDPTLGVCRETCESQEECQNGGVCRGSEEMKFCHCKRGLEGDRCEIITECLRGKYSKCEESGGNCVFGFSNVMCLCPEHKMLDATLSICREKCLSNYDCENGGKCIMGLCRCKSGTSGDRCEIIEGCDILKCEEIDATCIWDITKEKPTCRCHDQNYYFENGKCHPEWCKAGCNSAVSVCEYKNGLGICRCKYNRTYYDYYTKVCKQVDRCLSMECKEGICRNGVCECPENYFKYGNKCEPLNLCKSNACFIGANCETGSTFGFIRCFCNASEFYLPRQRKCHDGSCFLPVERKNCKRHCPVGMIRKEGECKHKSYSNNCAQDCGFLGWCYKISAFSYECVCDPTYAELNRETMKCVLKASAVCPTGEKDGDNKCKCLGKYKRAKNGITCELRSCSDEDVQNECKNMGAVKCVDNWKNDIGYRCVCPDGYINDRYKGCVDPCSFEKMKDQCLSAGQLCYIGNKRLVGDCRCPPTFTYDAYTKSCRLSGDNTFMIRSLPVLSKKYEISSNNINKVLLSIDVITSMKQTYNNLDFAHIFSFRASKDVVFCDVWLQFKSELPLTTMEVRRWRFQLMEMRKQTVLPPDIVLSARLLDEVIEEELTLCSNSLQQLVCGTGSTCFNNVCDCAHGYRIIDSTVKVWGPKRILRCEDIDECSENIHTCSDNSTCINTPGDYYCQCKPGYKKDENDFQWITMDKRPCTELCDPNPCENGICLMKNESIYCKCDKGFTGMFCKENLNTEYNMFPLLIGVIALFWILIMMLSGALCYVCFNKRKV